MAISGREQVTHTCVLRGYFQWKEGRESSQDWYLQEAVIT